MRIIYLCLWYLGKLAFSFVIIKRQLRFATYIWCSTSLLARYCHRQCCNVFLPLVQWKHRSEWVCLKYLKGFIVNVNFSVMKLSGTNCIHNYVCIRTVYQAKNRWALFSILLASHLLSASLKIPWLYRTRINNLPLIFWSCWGSGHLCAC